MKNKVDLKKYITINIILIVILTLIYIKIHNYENNMYRNITNQKISNILEEVINNYPNVDTLELIKILNQEELKKSNILNSYGIDINKENIIELNNKKEKKLLIINSTYIMFLFIILFSTFIIYLIKKDKKIKEITYLIEEINKKNYLLEIDNNTEDELSILKNELYKITIFLKEQAENSKKDKLELKKSLENISHQLKTPLTGIMISLDNLIYTDSLNEKTRKKFLNTIKKEVTSINFLVATILNLSKLDTNSIEFINKEYEVIDIVNQSIKNLEMLSDLKTIEIIIKSKTKTNKIICDKKWQTEALTNILKNALEHSENNSKIYINLEKTKLYSQIEIKSNSIIDKEDLPNIFKRFYKGKNSLPDSVGIGLSLAKTIIEKNNGKITVESNKQDKTTFIIKYY